MLTETGPEPLPSGTLPSPDSGITHGFFTRIGGVSEGVYRGLNAGTGSNDHPERIAENRRRVCRHLGVRPESLVNPFQVHSTDVIVVDKPFSGERPKADGIVTAAPGIAVGVLTADCGPVLFVDPQARVVGAAHAGWKGALNGVLENTVKAMEALGANRRRIAATLGPAISMANYEVDPEFVQSFTEAGPDNETRFPPSGRPGHSMFDLPGYIVDRLIGSGIRADSLNLCTYADEERFYSYRRAMHRGEHDYGRQISAIKLEKI